MTLADWLLIIEQQHPVKWDLGLARVGEVGRRLGVLKPAPLTFLVAGTNGKGSTCEYLYQLCRTQNLKVGKSTSPHLQRFNERIEVQGEATTDAEICRAFAAIDEARAEISLSYFEFGALAALLVFKWQAVDVAILEVGLGGRLDAMNMTDPDVSVITRIALDHQSWLGDTRALISVEKAGILRAGKPWVLADREPPVEMLALAENLAAPVHRLGQAFDIDLAQLWFTPAQGLQTVAPLPALALPADSLAAAVQAMACAGFGLTDDDIIRAATDGHVAGRLQRPVAPKPTLLDVAHNPDAAAYLCHRLTLLPQAGRMHAVVGMYADKDHAAVLGLMLPLVSHFYCTAVDEARALPAPQMAATVSNLGGSVVGAYDKVATAYAAALDNCDDDDLIVVFGSFPIVAEVLDYLDATTMATAVKPSQELL
ncbi:MAG: dihydrofolate synthase/folylpolyglutamate synthase [Candidatus Azotimanducaceae bacterium]|jgi:dihydrofolate synthase/folylpolyglutamate synthase